MLYRRGWPTSVVLLLLMVVSELSLPLGRHPPLGLHHLFCLVGAPRALVPLVGVVVLQVGWRVAAARVAVVGHGRGPRVGVGAHAAYAGWEVSLSPAAHAGPAVSKQGAVPSGVACRRELLGRTHVDCPCQTSCRS